MSYNKLIKVGNVVVDMTTADHGMSGSIQFLQPATTDENGYTPAQSSYLHVDMNRYSMDGLINALIDMRIEMQKSSWKSSNKTMAGSQAVVRIGSREFIIDLKDDRDLLQNPPQSFLPAKTIPF